MTKLRCMYLFENERELYNLLFIKLTRMFLPKKKIRRYFSRKIRMNTLSVFILTPLSLLDYSQFEIVMSFVNSFKLASFINFPLYGNLIDVIFLETEGQSSQN